MTETKNPGEKTLSVHSTKTLTLKRGVEQGVVRQSFSHGRTKPVVVEKVKRRTIGERPEAAAPASERVAAGLRPVAKAPAPAAAAAAAAPKPAAAPAGSAAKSGVVLRTLTDEERNARAHALADARVREAEERRTAEEEARRRSLRDVQERGDRDAAEARKRDEEHRRRIEEEAKRKAEQEAKKRFGEEEAKPKGVGAVPLPGGRTVTPELGDDDGPRTARRGPGGAARPAVPPKPAPKVGEKRRGRLTLVTALSADDIRERSVASFRRLVQRMSGHRQNEDKE